MSEVVEVTGVGEVEVRPTLATLTLFLTSQKDTVNLCRSSIEKRRPYVYQTLLNNKAQTSDVSEAEEVRQNEGGGIELEVRVTATLPIPDANTVVNILTEKLGNTISIQKMAYRHSTASLSEARVKAGRRAAEEARQRATDMATAVGAVLGPCLEMVEEACTHVATTHDKRESWVVDTALRQQETHAHTPIIIYTTVRVRFALLAYGAPKKKKS